MENKNKYNDYFNGGNNTPEYFTKEKENEIKNVEESIVESTDANTVETTSVNNITPEFVEIIDNEEEIEKTDSLEESTEESQNNNSETNIQSVRVNARALNIRKEPNKDADIVTIVYKDEILVLRESTSIDGFYKVRTNNGFDGYCMEQFVDLV